MAYLRRNAVVRLALYFYTLSSTNRPLEQALEIARRIADAWKPRHRRITA
jgi:hypothetical protein